MRFWLAFAAGVLLLAIAVAVAAPASLLDGRLATATEGKLRIADASGTLWNGSGNLVLLPSGIRRSLAWHIDAWPLLSGELRGTIATDPDMAQRAEFTYGHSSTALRGLDVAVPMDALLQSVGLPAALGAAGGSLESRIERFVQTRDAIDSDLTLLWRDASVPAMAPGARIQLGDVRLDLRGTGPEVAGSLSNVGGEVEIAGRVAFTAALAPKVDATIRPRAGLDRDRAEMIVSALSLIGSADGQGGYRIAWAR